MKPKESQWYALIQCDAKHYRNLGYTRMQALQLSSQGDPPQLKPLGRQSGYGQSKHAMPNQERIRGT
jgi:hypothetical protein